MTPNPRILWQYYVHQTDSWEPTTAEELLMEILPGGHCSAYRAEVLVETKQTATVVTEIIDSHGNRSSVK